jgi:hypothetical protein
MSRKFDFLKKTSAARVADTLSTQKSDSPKIQQSEKPRGRPAGKRTDPDYAQVTAYIRKDTHHAVKLRLMQENQGREFSELVQELLAEWLKKDG